MPLWRVLTFAFAVLAGAADRTAFNEIAEHTVILLCYGSLEWCADVVEMLAYKIGASVSRY